MAWLLLALFLFLGPEKVLVGQTGSELALDVFVHQHLLSLLKRLRLVFELLFILTQQMATLRLHEMKICFRYQLTWIAHLNRISLLSSTSDDSLELLLDHRADQC